MSAPLSDSALIEALRAIVLGVKVGDIADEVVAALEERRWLDESLITSLGQDALKEDGDLALSEIFEWLDSPEARAFFQE